MKIAICDDDKNELFRILSVLADYQTQRNIEFSYKPFDNSTELASNLLQEHYDIYLLDVVMPGLNGIELAKEIRSSDKSADIIFLTSSPEFAVESYTVKASNYLVKPVSRDRLVEALDDIMRTRTEDRDSCLVLKSSVGVHKVHISEIIYIEALNRKVIYYLRNNSQITCVEKFASVCDQLLQHPEFLLAAPLFSGQHELYSQDLGDQETLPCFSNGGIHMSEFVSLLELINYGFVLFFGIVMSLYLADIHFEDNKIPYIITILALGAIQLLSYLMMGENLLYKCYPLLIHLPLVLLIRFAFHRNIYIATISVLSAYLMCTPRKWFGTLAAFFFDGSPVVANLVSICVTIPLLYLVIRYIAPYIIRLHYENKKTLLLFFLLPLSYYILEYTLTVYTDLLYTGGPVIIDFMDSFLVLFFFILAMVSLDFSNKKSTAERENLLLTTAAAQA